MSLSAGAIVGNNVRLVRPLKRGGMGSVWLAEHLTLRTQVAVKFMSERLAQDPEYVARFTREAMASAQIKSPHVVQVFDHGVSPDGSAFIVMELLEGEDLRARLARVGTIGVEEAAVVVAHVGRALSKAHGLGIVHRDIKPDNVFLTDQDGELFAKILDFGIAKHAAADAEALDGMTGTGAMVGTPHYMSPEQILSARRVDHRADLWSVAVVLYRALTGHVPFQGETLGAVCIAIERGAFVPPSQRRPGLLPSLDAWFLRALARDPAQRFQSAKEMSDAFGAALAAGGVSVTSAPYRPEMSAHSISMPLAALSGGGTPPPRNGSVTAASWVPGVTPPPMAHTRPPLAATPLPFPPAGGAVAPPSGSGRTPSLADVPWVSSGVGAAPAQPQTFHGASVTQAEWSSSSRRRAVVTLVSAALGVIVLLVILIVVLAGKSQPEMASAPSASATSAAASGASVEVPPATALAAPAASDAAQIAAPAASDAAPIAASAAPSETAAAKVEPAASTAAAKASAAPAKPHAAPTSTGKPRRDRGF